MFRRFSAAPFASWPRRRRVTPRHPAALPSLNEAWYWLLVGAVLAGYAAGVLLLLRVWRLG